MIPLRADIADTHNGRKVRVGIRPEYFQPDGDTKITGKVSFIESQGRETLYNVMLPDGNILIADSIAGKVLEIARDGRKVWDYQVDTPLDVFRLPNGNTLITKSDEFIKIDPEEKIVWKRKTEDGGSAR